MEGICEKIDLCFFDICLLDNVYGWKCSSLLIDYASLYNSEPIATTDTATSVTPTTATLNATYDNQNNDISSFSSIYFEYGTDLDYGNAIEIVTFNVADTVELSLGVTDLDPNTTYHFRLAIVDDAVTYYYEDQTFQTLQHEPQDSVTDTAVFTSDTTELTIHSGDYIQGYGTSEPNTVNVKSGGKIECLNFVGSNVINFEEDSTGFTVHRSGAMVYFENSTTKTLVKIPATTTPQNIVFSDISRTLKITSNRVMLGDQVVDLTIAGIEGGTEPSTFTNSLGMTFVPIQPGTFMTGSPDDETQHQVTLTQGYSRPDPYHAVSGLVI
jgi:hypothetical protein